MSLVLKSKQKSQNKRERKNVENKLNEFNNTGRSNLSQQAKCALKVIATSK